MNVRCRTRPLPTARSFRCRPPGAPLAEAARSCRSPRRSRPSSSTIRRPTAGRARPRLTALFDGQPLRGAVDLDQLSSCAPAAAGTSLLVGRGAASLTGRRVDAGARGASSPRSLDGDWLQSPLADGGGAGRGLADEGRRRLLRLFLTTGASLFGRGAAEFGAAARRLAETLRLRRWRRSSWCPVGAAGRLLSYRLPAGVGRGGRSSALVALGRPTRLARLDGWELLVEAAGSAALLHLFLPGAVAGRGQAGRPRRGASCICGRPTRSGAAPLAPGWRGAGRRSRGLGRRAGGGAARRPTRSPRRWCASCAARRGAAGGGAAPVGDAGRGALCAVDLADPHGLVRAVRIERGGRGARSVGAPRRGLAGFAARCRGGRRRPCRLSLVSGPGGSLAVHEGVPAAFAGRGAGGLGGGAGRGGARRGCELPRGWRRPGCEDFGGRPAEPALSVIAPVGDEPRPDPGAGGDGLRRARGAAVEIVCHVRPGRWPRRRGARSPQAEAVYGIAHRLVTLAGGGDGGGRAPRGAGGARGAAAALLGAERAAGGAGMARRPGGGGSIAARPVLGGTLLDIGGAALRRRRASRASRRPAHGRLPRDRPRPRARRGHRGLRRR